MNADTPLRLDVAGGSGYEFGDCAELSLKPLVPHCHRPTSFICWRLPLGSPITSGKFDRIGNVSNTNTLMISALIGLDKARRHEPNIVGCCLTRDTS